MSKDIDMALAQPQSFHLGSLLLVVNQERPDACEAAVHVQAWGEAHQVSVLHAEDLTAENTATPDLVVSLGGDGTVLRAIQILGGQNIPVISPVWNLRSCSMCSSHCTQESCPKMHASRIE